MRYSDGQSNLVWVNKAFPNVLVKTYFGNTYLNRLYKNKWMLIYSNPHDLIPCSHEEKLALIEVLEALRQLNCQLVGFSSRSFEEHLSCTNWINSYLCDEHVFPVFYLTDNMLDSIHAEALKSQKTGFKDPIYLVDGLGIARIILNGVDPKERNMKKILGKVGKIIPNEQYQLSPTFISEN